MLRMIKICLSFMMLLAQVFCNVGALADQKEPGIGYYAGLGIGITAGQFDIQSTTSVQPSNAFFYNQVSNPSLANTNVLGSLFAGKLFTTKYLAIGPELHLNIGRPRVSWNESAALLFPTETLTTHTQTQLNTLEGGIDARIGSFFNSDHLVYARIGLSVNKLNAEATAIDARPLNTIEASVYNSFTRFCYGLRLGAGFEQPIFSKLFLRGDYVFTAYPSMSQSAIGFAQGIAPGFQLGPVANATSVKANTQVVLLSLVYYW